MTTAEFEAAYLEARANVHRAYGDQRAIKAAETAARKIETAARKAGQSIDGSVLELDDRAHKLVVFPNHAEHKLSYTRNAMHCIDCGCLATA